jgi:undecaprenyl-diphosphatase
MDLIQAVILGIVQGLTEFIPVSSSGHLVLVPALLGWSAPGLAFDTVLHLGTALALIVYFRREWVALIVGGMRSLLKWRIESVDERLAWLVVLGCIPAAAAGYLLEDFFSRVFEAPIVAAYFLLVTAGILTIAEAVGKRTRTLEKIRLPDALVVGIAQAVAILPGISRSGATISAGVLLGFERDAAARYSFLLGAPIILGAGLLQLPQALKAGNEGAGLPSLLVGFLVAAGVGYLCVSYLLRYLRRGSLYPFAAYCAVAGLLAAIELGGFAG